MVTFPPCKINLGLHVLSKRPDGYHSISTCFYPLPWTDVLEVLPAKSESFAQSGNLIPGGQEDNLCLKAYRLLQNDFDIPPVQIHLHKIIPTGAGLGGGSSNASYMLRSLNSIFELELSKEQLMKYALLLGSDCAFFIQDNPMLGSGRGEILEPVSLRLKGFYLVLITPDLHISTAEAYGLVTPTNPSHSIRQLIEKPTDTWRDTLKNDFEPPIFQKYPTIQAIKETLYSLGALYSSMSGSGSSVFGIFEKETQTEIHFRNSLRWSGWL